MPLDDAVAKLAVDAARRATATLGSVGPGARRYWTCKKRDPRAPPVAHLSDLQLKARARGPSVPLARAGFEALARVAAGITLESACAPLRLGAPEESAASSPTGASPTFATEASIEGANSLDSPPRSVATDEAARQMLALGLRPGGATLSELAEMPDAAARRLARLRRVAHRPPPRRMRIGPSYRGGYDASLENGYGPFSQSSLKSQRRGTRFPSATALIEAPKVEEDSSRDAFSLAAATRFGGTEPPKDIVGHMGLRELERLDQSVARSAKDMSALDHTSFIFPATHFDLSLSSANADIAKLRTEADKLVAARRRRVESLEIARVAIADRARADGFCARQLERGEQTLITLDQRLDAVRVALAESAALGAYYAEVVRVSNDARPVAGHHRMEIVEKQLVLARVQAEDLLDKRRTLHEAAEDAAKFERPKLKRKQKKWAAMRAVARERTRLVLAELDDVRGTIAGLDEKRRRPRPRAEDDALLASSSSSRLEAPSTAGASKAEMLAALGETKSKRRVDDVDRSDDLYELEEKMRFMKLAAGATEPGAVARKLKRAKELGHALDQQHHEAIIQSTHLKQQLEAIQTEFSELQLAGSAPVAATPLAPPSDEDESAGRSIGARSGEDGKFNNDDLFQADLHLTHARRHFTDVQRHLATVSTGVLHLARILQAYTKRGEEPVVPLTVDRALVDDIEKGDLPDADAGDDVRAGVVSLLTKCEDTIVSVREALSINKQIGDGDESPAASPIKDERPATHDLSRPKRLASTAHLGRADPGARAAHASAEPAVRVVTSKLREKELARAARRREKRDRDAAASELAPVEAPEETPATALVRAGLAAKPVADALRRANMLSKLKQGPRAPLGLAVSQAIKASKRTAEKHATSATSKPRQLGLSDPHMKITTREQLKEGARRGGGA